MTPSIFSATKKLWSLLTKKEKWQWGKIATISLLISLLEITAASSIMIFAQVLSQPGTARKYFDFIGLSETLPPQHDLIYITLSVGLIYFFKNILAMFATFYEHRSIHQMRHRFKIALLARYAQADYNFYLTRNASEGVSVVSSDVNLSFSNGMTALTILISEGTVFVGLLSMIIFMNPPLAFALLGIGIVSYFILTKMVFPRFYRWGQATQEATRLSYEHLLQFFHAFKEMILLAKRQTFIEAYQVFSQQDARLQSTQNATNILPRMITELLFIMFFVIVVSYLCIQGQSSQTMLSILGVYLYTGFRLMPGLNRVVTQLNLFKTIIPAINRVHQEYHSTTHRESLVDTPNFSFQHTITLQHVSFRYCNQVQDALKDINLVINKGECIGIIGKSGSGKSTLTDIILGLLKPHTGTVLIDNQYPVNSPQWHSHIGYVQQAIYLTDSTIKANIAFGERPPEVNIARLNQAVYDAQLYKLLESLPLGLETTVGERGIRLSGGERQRIAIARALYRNPSVLIFDEATSALDNETETSIMEVIHNLRQSNRTIIIIAHRLSTLKYCDKIVSITNGEINNITQPDTHEIY